MPDPFSTVFLNGAFTERSAARISPDDRGFQLGEGVFDTLRSHNGAFFRFDSHFVRLESGLRALAIDPPFSRDGLRKILGELLERNHARDAVARVTVTRGSGGGGFRLDPAALTTTYISLRAAPDAKRLREVGLILSISRTERPPGFFGRGGGVIKTTSIGAMAVARILSPADEMIMVDGDGNLAEGTSSAILVVSDDHLVAPPIDRVLPSITRSVIGEIVEIEERDVSLDELLRSEAIVAATSSMGPIPALRIERHELNIHHPLVAEIVAGYESKVHAECGHA